MSYKPTVMQGYDLKDRTDGIEINIWFTQGSRKINISDDEAKELANELLRAVETDDRPVMDGKYQ